MAKIMIMSSRFGINQKWKRWKIIRTCTYNLMFYCYLNCFCCTVDRRKAFNLISSQNHCQRSLLLRISDAPWAEFESVQNLSLGFVKWSCVVMITTTLRRHCGGAFEKFRNNSLKNYGSFRSKILVIIWTHKL